MPYQNLTQNTLQAIAALPVVIPVSGLIAGYTLLPNELAQPLNQHDNLHFPMGTAYLDLGVPGVAQLARQQLSHCPQPSQQGLLYGIAVTCDEITAWFARHVAALDEMLSSAVGEEKERLSMIRDNIVPLIHGKPQTFPQAVQLMYFMWRLRSANWCSCIGRLDMHLLPFYEADMAADRLTDEKALFWICQLWEQINACGSGDTLIQLMVGGQDENGNDTSNPLSLLMLRATRIVRKTEPHINLRVHKNTPSQLLEEAYRVQLMGHGQATIYNDDVIIPSLIAHGVPREYACRYANNGCTEIVFDGLSAIEFNHIDAVAVFELALNNGSLTPKEARPVPYFHKDNPAAFYSPDVFPGYESGDTDKAATFEEFYAIFLRQYRHQLDRKLEIVKNDLYQARKDWECSLIINGSFLTVLQSGQDICNGGLPMTDFMTFLGSIPTVADCLMGVKHAVYDQKLTDMPTLKKALAANFRGCESLRAALLAAPKFGNDIDEVDMLAADILSQCCDWIDAFSQASGLRIWPAAVGWRFVEEAYGIGATPDGRLYGDPIAEHYCATPGKATHGPTALLHSITKAPLYRSCGVAATHVSLPASVSANEEAGLMTLRTLNTVARQRGIFMLNIAIYDVDSLKKAQCRPEDYQDLIVRVWGFSARFVDLSREMQDHVISRILKS